MIREIRIKVLTYDDMYYTYAVINEDTDDVIDFSKICGEIDEETGLPKLIPDTSEVPLEEKVKAVASFCIEELKQELEKDRFIYCRPEDKIINVKEIKETVINEY